MTLITGCAICRIQYRILLGLNWTDGWNESNLVALYDLANTTLDGTARCFMSAITHIMHCCMSALQPLHTSCNMTENARLTVCTLSGTGHREESMLKIASLKLASSMQC